MRLFNAPNIQTQSRRPCEHGTITVRVDHFLPRLFWSMNDTVTALPHPDRLSKGVPAVSTQLGPGMGMPIRRGAFAKNEWQFGARRTPLGSVMEHRFPLSPLIYQTYTNEAEPGPAVGLSAQ